MGRGGYGGRGKERGTKGKEEGRYLKKVETTDLLENVKTLQKKSIKQLWGVNTLKEVEK